MAAFQDLSVAVTGGTGALGTAVCAALLEAGARVHIPCFAPEELQAFPLAGREGLEVQEGVDLRSEEQVVAWYAALPPLWASIHCAGGFAMAPLAETTASSWRHLMQMNADTCFLCSREAVRNLRRSGRGGRIVNIAARPALEPRTGAGMAAYTASKAAVAALTEALGEELAGEGILVTAVAPSILDTPANRRAMPDADHEAWPKLEEVARVILFLASPENRVVRSGLVPVYGAC